MSFQGLVNSMIGNHNQQDLRNYYCPFHDSHNCQCQSQMHAQMRAMAMNSEPPIVRHIASASASDIIFVGTENTIDKNLLLLLDD